MKILAIETSCDDTCAAVLDDDRVLSNVISSQTDLHAKWGGVVPNIAKRAHMERIRPVVDEALKKIGGIEKIDVIAVTYGPGLAIALGVGVNYAKELALKYNKKLVAVNHIEGHLMANWIKNSRGKPEREITLPALNLTASGGHSKIILIKAIGDYQELGETLDDAAGEALDKAAKILGLGYPGGPVIEQLAQKGETTFLTLPRPMAKSKSLDFSFSGLKTSFYYQVKDWPKEKIERHLADLAASFQMAVIDSLMIKFTQAIEITQPTTLLLSGGVSANQLLRRRMRQIAKEKKLKLWMPTPKIYSTDNAAMIGVAGYYRAKQGNFVKDIEKLDREPRAQLMNN